MARTISAILNLRDNFSNTLRNTTNNTKQFQRQLKMVGNTAKEMKSVIVGSFAGIVAGVGFLELGKQSIMLASDLQEVANVVDVTFGDGAKTINDWSKNALSSFGLSELQAKKFNGTLGALMKSSGLSGDKLLDMSTNLSGLSADFASFYNLDPEEAFDKIKSGISGETEPLKALGINMSVANMEAYALTQGVKKQWKEMSQAEQVTLRYGYLMKSSADAQGDFARTSKGFANQLRIAKVTLQQVGATIASYVLPFLNRLLIGFNNVLGFMPAVIDGFKNLVGQLMKVSSVKEGLYLIFITLNSYIYKLFPSISETFSRIYNVVVEVVGGIIDNVIRIGKELASPFMEAFNSIISLAKTVGNTIIDMFSSVSSNTSMTTTFNAIRDVLAGLLVDITKVCNFINDNWSSILPIIEGITLGIVAWKLAIIAVNTWATIVTATTALWETISLVIWGIVNATTAWEAVQWMLNVAMDANPIGAVILLVTAIGIAIYEVIVHWQDICTWVSTTWDKLKNNPIVEFIALMNPFTGVLFEVAKHFTDISNAISSAWKWLTDWNGTDAQSKDINVNTNTNITDDSGNTTKTRTPRFATGTQYFKGGRAEVGEHGGEIMNLPNGTQVIPADKTNQLLKGAGASAIVNVTIQGNVIGNEQFINEIGQVITSKVKVALINM